MWTRANEEYICTLFHICFFDSKFYHCREWVPVFRRYTGFVLCLTLQEQGKKYKRRYGFERNIYFIGYVKYTTYVCRYDLLSTIVTKFHDYRFPLLFVY